MECSSTNEEDYASYMKGNLLFEQYQSGDTALMNYQECQIESQLRSARRCSIGDEEIKSQRYFHFCFDVINLSTLIFCLLLNVSKTIQKYIHMIILNYVSRLLNELFFLLWGDFVFT